MRCNASSCYQPGFKSTCPFLVFYKNHAIRPFKDYLCLRFEQITTRDDECGELFPLEYEEIMDNLQAIEENVIGHPIGQEELLRLQDFLKDEIKDKVI